MSDQFMTISQQSRAAGKAVWELAPGRALQLAIGPGARELLVLEGRLWLTGRGTLCQPGQDLWLQAGDSVQLQSGSAWVAEGWSGARFQLLVPPQACAPWRWRERALSASAWRRLFAWAGPSSPPPGLA